MDQITSRLFEYSVSLGLLLAAVGGLVLWVKRLENQRNEREALASKHCQEQLAAAIQRIQSLEDRGHNESRESITACHRALEKTAEALPVLASALHRFADKVALVVFSCLLLAGCGTQREEVQRQEHQEETTTKITTTTETTKPNEVGQPVLVEAVHTVTYTEQVSHGEAAAEIQAKTTIQVPEVAAVGRFAATAGAAMAPGASPVVSSLLGWLTGTPDGAATGITGGLTLAVGIAKALKDRRDNKALRQEHEAVKTDFDAVVKSTSNFMQENPEQAKALKDSHSKAMDRSTKERVKRSRAAQGLL